MAAYLIQLKDSHPGLRKADALVISAADSANALAMAKAIFGEDSNAAWADATVTTLADVAANAPGLAGWRLRVKILNSTPPVDVTVTGTGTDDTIDEIGTLMAAALVALALPVLTATYTAGTQVLQIAAIGDNLGDKKVEVEWYPPTTISDDPVPIPGLVSSIVDEGIAAAVLTATFAADAYVAPKLYAKITGRIE